MIIQIPTFQGSRSNIIVVVDFVVNVVHSFVFVVIVDFASVNCRSLSIVREELKKSI